MGLPILLVTPKGVATDLVLSTRSGLWAPPEKPDELAGMVARLSGRKRLLALLGRKGSAASGRFSRERQAQEMLKILESAAAGDGRRTGVGTDARRYLS